MAAILSGPQCVNSSSPEQNNGNFEDDIFKYSLWECKILYFWLIFHSSFVPKGQINNIPVLVKIMAWRRIGGNPISEPMMTQFNDAYMLQ